MYQVLLTFFRFGKLLNEKKKSLFFDMPYSITFYLYFLRRTCELMQTKYIPLLVDTYACMYYRITRTRTSWYIKSKNIEYSSHIDTCREIHFYNFASFWLHKVKLHIIKGMCNIIQPAAFYSGISSIRS